MTTTNTGRTLPAASAGPKLGGRRMVVAILLLVLLLGAVATQSAQAQTFTTLYSFGIPDGASIPDGVSPVGALVQATDGNFYGTTYSGGGALNAGTVFKMTSRGVLTTLYRFCPQSPCVDGSGPYGGLVQGIDGNFYGTTLNGGTNGSGTVFRITSSGALTTLHSFSGTDGSSPYAGLVQGTDGNFYGTTSAGGAGLVGAGTVFKITPSGALTTLYSFCPQAGCSDGNGPIAGLVEASDGNFYGVTYNGPSTLFKVTPDGAFTALYTFCPGGNCADGISPEGGLVQGTDGSLYGIARFGGIGYTIGGTGGGTIFKVSLSGTFTKIYSFCSQSLCTDGSQPIGALIQGTDGNFYGTTWAGGANPAPPNLTSGTIFKITPDGMLTTLHSFCSQPVTGTDGSISNCVDGLQPVPALVQASDGNVYGTTAWGGTNGGYGTVFRLSLGPTLTSIEVKPGSVEIDVGQTQPYTATGHYSDDSTKDLTAQVTWTSSSTAVATITPGPLATPVATAVGPGSTEIRASLGSVIGRATLIVNAQLVTIEVSPLSQILKIGQQQSYTATGHYSDNSTKDVTAQVTWASDNAAVATITPGPLPNPVATAVGAGTAQISASLGGKFGYATLTVSPPLTITVSPNSAAVDVGLTQPFTATGNYSDGTKQDLTSLVTWTSSNTARATITAAGVATGVSPGVTTITATLGSVGELGASLTVRPPMPTFSLDPSPTYNSTQTVFLSDTYPEATFFYSTTPGVTTLPKNKYNPKTGIAVSKTTTIYAIAIVNGISSQAAPATYTINRKQ